MDKGENFEVKDIGLAEKGKKNIEWAEMQMGSLLKVRERFEKERPLQGYRIGIALHVTKETAALVRTLVAGGAEVAICSCNPLSTQDDVAAALASEGIRIYGYRGESKEDYYRFLNKVIEFKPNITIDDGCDLVSEIHRNHPELIKDVICGMEETSTGIVRLKAMENDNALKYPVIAVNDNKTKHLVDNYYGSGQSTLDGIVRATDILLAGKTVVICGYGDCGKGVALRAKGMGANVVVTEIHPFRALQALFDGCRVMPIKEAAKMGNVFITVTGNKGILRAEHMELMPDKSIICNSGHFDVEIDYKGLEHIAVKKREIRPLVEEFTLKNGRRIICLASGRLVNLSCGSGHPSIVMATSFCGQALAAEYGIKNKGKLKPGIHMLPEEIDDHIAELQLEDVGIQKDIMTEEQKKYMKTWSEGT